jgi:hypothetical protein
MISNASRAPWRGVRIYTHLHGARPEAGVPVHHHAHQRLGLRRHVRPLGAVEAGALVAQNAQQDRLLGGAVVGYVTREEEVGDDALPRTDARSEFSVVTRIRDGEEPVQKRQCLIETAR